MNDQRLLQSPVRPADGNFTLGKVVITKAARLSVDRDNDCIACFWSAHLVGDWGEVDDEQWEANNAAVVAGRGEVQSLFATSTGEWIEIVTNADWTQTVVRGQGEV